LIGHENNDAVTGGMFKTQAHCPTLSVLAGISHGSYRWNTLLQASNDIPGAIAAPVINNDDLMRDLVQAHFNVQMLHRGGDIPSSSRVGMTSESNRKGAFSGGACFIGELTTAENSQPSFGVSKGNSGTDA
jgi:hypothetical protein